MTLTGFAEQRVNLSSTTAGIGCPRGMSGWSGSFGDRLYTLKCGVLVCRPKSFTVADTELSGLLFRAEPAMGLRPFARTHLPRGVELAAAAACLPPDERVSGCAQSVWIFADDPLYRLQKRASCQASP